MSALFYLIILYGSFLSSTLLQLLLLLLLILLLYNHLYHPTGLIQYDLSPLVNVLHHVLKLLEVYHPVSVFIIISNYLLPLLVLDVRVLVPEDVLQLSRCDLPIGVQVEQVKGLLQVLVSEQLVQIRSCCYEL
jgi:hypothetical protein